MVAEKGMPAKRSTKATVPCGFSEPSLCTPGIEHWLVETVLARDAWRIYAWEVLLLYCAGLIISK